MTVSLLEIQAAARAHAAPFAAESAGYLLLAVLDHVLSAPRVVAAREVELLADGGVRLKAGSGGSTPGESPELAARLLLASTLEVASSVGPALRRVSERREQTGLSALVRELESALIPVNRSAAKRALCRLYRETERAKAAGQLEAALPALPLALSAVAVAPLPPEPTGQLPEAAQHVSEAELAEGEQAFTKPEPVVQRAKERGSSTPRLGTAATAQTRVEEDLRVDEDLGAAERAPFALLEQQAADPEPSRLPDVLTAMLELHTGVGADEAPTRLRDVVTEVRAAHGSREPQIASDAWLERGPHRGVVGAPKRFESEVADPSLHDALTWNPGPVLSSTQGLVAPALLMVGPDSAPSPRAPAFVAARSSDVSELVDAFHVSGAGDERDLRSALKEMAGLELTPMPHLLREEG